MSTPQTEAHNLLQENIRDNFITVLETVSIEAAEDLLLELDKFDDADDKTVVWCENYLNDYKREVEENATQEYLEALNMHK